MQRHAGDELLTISVDPDTLDCPICFHTLRPPVFQCAVGHVLCSSCHDRLRQSRKCPECSVATGFGRCYSVERILRSFRVPCPNAARGCAVKTSLHERDVDELTSHFISRVQFRLQPDEYLTSVEGHYSHFNGNVIIRSLKFVSNLRTHGPYGNACGVRFSLPAGAGGRIVGFHARCDDQYLHAIGTYVKMDDSAS